MSRGMGSSRRARSGEKRSSPRRPSTPRPTRTDPLRRGSARTGSSHPHASAGPRPVGCAVITVSDTRGRHEDASGDRIERLVRDAGHAVVSRAWVRDEIAAVRAAARAALRRKDVDAVVVTGGTGVSPRDRTPEALEPLITTPLPGFGERFRARSESQVGSAAWLSRAGAGVANGRLLVFLPGSTRAVELALTTLLLPELEHVVRLIGRFDQEE